MSATLTPPPLPPSPPTPLFGGSTFVPPPLPPLPIPMPPAGPVAVLPYATPHTADVTMLARPPEGMWRDGDTLVTLRNVAFPLRCVKCNRDVAGDANRVPKRVLWHHPALYVLAIFPGILVYLLVAAFVRSSARGDPCLCDVHRRGRTTAIVTAWLLFLGGLSTIVGACFLYGEDAFRDTAVPANVGFAGGLVLVLGLAWGHMRGRLLVPTKIGPQYACYAGADDRFLNSLPEGARP